MVCYLTTNFNLSGDPLRAAKLLERSLMWRRSNEIENLITWQPSERLRRKYPISFVGFDRRAIPVWLVRMGKCDISG